MTAQGAASPKAYQWRPAYGYGSRTSTSASLDRANLVAFDQSSLFAFRLHATRAFLGDCEMHVVNSLAGELAVVPEPGELRLFAHRFLAAVFFPVDVWLYTKYARALLAAWDVLSHEGTDVQSHTVVDVRFPADGLLLDRFPADENVERRFAFEDGHEPLLQLQCRGQAILGTAFAAFYAIPLPCDPVAEITIGECFEEPAPFAVAFGQPVITNQRVKAIALAAIPDVPDKWPMMEQLAVLVEELIAQPLIEAAGASVCEQFREPVVTPPIAPGSLKQMQESLVTGGLSADGRQAHNTVCIRQLEQTIRAERRAIGETGTGLARPLVAEQPRHGHVQRLVCTGRVAVEQPLRRFAGKRLRQSVRIFLRRHLLPVRQVEGHFDQYPIPNKKVLVQLPHRFVEGGVAAKCPQSWQHIGFVWDDRCEGFVVSLPSEDCRLKFAHQSDSDTSLAPSLLATLVLIVNLLSFLR